MKNKSFIFIFLAVAMSFAHVGVFAQDYVPTPVTISKEKVKVDGKLYYSHIVLERQTLYSICKAYGVTSDDVYAANPTLAETGLRKNAIILIPVVDKDVAAADGKNASSSDGVPQLNGSGASGSGSAGSSVSGSGSDSGSSASGSGSSATGSASASKKGKAKKSSGDTVIHTVKWYEDLDVIAEKYGVSVESIIQANNLQGRKLKNRQKLTIPLGGCEDVREEGSIEPAVLAGSGSGAGSGSDGSSSGSGSGSSASGSGAFGEGYADDKSVGESFKDEIKGLFPRFFTKHKVNAILMMPFNAGASKPSEGNMDFYCGALLALKDLGDNGIDIDLSVYDVADGNLHVTQERLSSSDVVIGPVSTGDVGRLLQVAPKGTVVVSPLDHRTESLVKSWPNLIQAPSSTKAQYKDLIHWIKEDKSADDPVIVIHEKGYNISWDDNALADMLSESGLNYKTFSYSILEGRQITGSLKNMMRADACNRVLIMSDSEAFVNDVVRNLNLMIHDKYDIALYGTSRIRSFETIEIDNLHNVNFHTSVAYYIDYESLAVKKFIMEYRALYNTEPTPYAYQGYDTAYWLLKTCSENGGELLDSIDGKQGSMLQTNFRFERAGEGQGYINTAVRRVVYGENYTITLQ